MLPQGVWQALQHRQVLQQALQEGQQLQSLRHWQMSQGGLLEEAVHDWQLPEQAGQCS